MRRARGVREKRCAHARVERERVARCTLTRVPWLWACLVMVDGTRTMFVVLLAT